MGKTLRVEETEEGTLTVAVLKEGSWAAEPLGMIGLRLSPTPAESPRRRSRICRNDRCGDTPQMVSSVPLHVGQTVPASP